VVWFLDEPCGDPAAFLTLALSEFTRRHVTVSLSGLGADEMFGGYRRYLAMGWHHLYRRVPRLVREQLIRPLVASVPEARTRPLLNYARVARKFVDAFDDDVRTTWAQTISYLPGYDGNMFGGALRDVRRATYTSDAFDRHWAEVAELASPIDQVMYMDLEMYLPDQLLFLQDKMSMAASLEARVPFLDYRLVELAATIPARLKIRGRVLKTILKRIAERYVPRDCIYRQKKGFVAPVETWLRGRLHEQVHDALSPRRVRERGILEVDFVEWMKREFYERGRDLSVQLYQALLLETWLRLFIDGESRKFTSGP
jgi:asparagine synthase (glutamine-hydrolysing)